jgi:putative glutamine amidotransferase
MSLPKILVSAKPKKENYINAIEEVGAIPCLNEEYDDSFDGLVLCGGSDIHPSYCNEEMDGSRNIDEARDKQEFALLKAFVEAGKPVLGICRGCQLINIFFGGTLYQDIVNAKEHSSSECDLVHNAKAEKGSVIAELYGEIFPINSAHHQAIKKLGDNLKITMLSEDETVIEGIEHTSLPIFAVQWHPERMCFEKQRSDTVDGAKIFEHFISICKKHMS